MPARWERELLRLREAPAPLDEMRERSQQPPRLGTSLRPVRERVIAGAVGLTVFVAVGAFAWGALRTFGDEPTASGGPPPTPAPPVTLWLSASRVPPGPVELEGVLVDHEGVDATFGVSAEVERWDGNEWGSYGFLVMCMDHWHCTARIESEGSGDVPAIGLGPRKGAPGPVERFTTEGLDVGWYRISQTANEGVVATGIFEVAEGAPLPAPLVNVDAPAISISPALVSPGGDEISLYPLIPPGDDGSLSREDILQATDGLSETARVERWEGTAWDAVATVDLLRVPGDSLPRSAMLPSLEPGAYRLVREGPERPHVGHFWVDVSP
jgi:hypothetical protein